MSHVRPLFQALLLASLLVSTGCDSDRPSAHERARLVWDEKIALAEKLIYDEEYWIGQPELQELGDFFYHLTGIGGIILPHSAGVLTLSPYAKETLVLLHEWCDENCDRLSVDAGTGQVVVVSKTRSPG